MARHLWQEDFEQRAAIRAAKDQSPAITVKELQRRFGTSGNIINSALQKTVAEWQALQQTAPARDQHRQSKPSKIVDDTSEQTQSPVSPPVVAGNCTRWEYHTIIVRGRAVLGDVVYEQQGKHAGNWELIAAKTLEGVLNSFGADRWELASMIVLSHGAAAFTGLYEMAFKRSLG